MQTQWALPSRSASGRAPRSTGSCSILVLEKHVLWSQTGVTGIFLLWPLPSLALPLIHRSPSHLKVPSSVQQLNSRNMGGPTCTHAVSGVLVVCAPHACTMAHMNVSGSPSVRTLHRGTSVITLSIVEVAIAVNAGASSMSCSMLGSGAQHANRREAHQMLETSVCAVSLRRCCASCATCDVCNEARFDTNEVEASSIRSS